MEWKWDRMNMLYLQFPSWLSSWRKKYEKQMQIVVIYHGSDQAFLFQPKLSYCKQHIILAEYITPGFHVSLLLQVNLYIFLHFYVYISGHSYIWWESTFSHSLRLAEGHQVKGFIRKIGGGSGNYQVTNQGRSRGRVYKLRI